MLVEGAILSSLGAGEPTSRREMATGILKMFDPERGLWIGSGNDVFVRVSAGE
jgi:hypothetical protein